MEILGLVFLGSATPHREAMTAFVHDTLGLTRVDAGTAEADMFALPDGSGFAVSDEREEGGATSRTVGLLVADLDTAVAELRAAGVAVDDPQRERPLPVRPLRRAGRRALRAGRGAHRRG